MENRIWEIIAASIHGEELSQEEISTLQVWLDENKQNRDEYARLQIFYAENKGGLFYTHFSKKEVKQNGKTENP